jgi:hypothetical protein
MAAPRGREFPGAIKGLSQAASAQKHLSRMVGLFGCGSGCTSSVRSPLSASGNAWDRWDSGDTRDSHRSPRPEPVITVRQIRQTVA